LTSLSTDEKLPLMLPYLRQAGLVADPPGPQQREIVRRVIEASGDRLKVAGDILAYADFFLVAEPEMDPEAVAKRLATPGAKAHLEAFAARLATVEPFEPTWWRPSSRRASFRRRRPRPPPRAAREPSDS